jgi:hypothetical protein
VRALDVRNLITQEVGYFIPAMAKPPEALLQDR